MSNLSAHLFQVIDDIPTTCPIQINIPCFKKLYMEDETSDKSNYTKQLVFIWYYLDANSPYFNSEDKLEECMTAAFGTSKYKVSKLLQECMDEYSKRQSTPELRSLQAIILLLDELINGLNSQKEDNQKETNRYIESINDQLRKEEDIDVRRMLLLRRSEAIKNTNDENTAIITQIPKIASIIKEMSDLRKSVSKSLIEIDSTTNKENIGNHIIYTGIDSYRGYN